MRKNQGKIIGFSMMLLTMLLISHISVLSDNVESITSKSMILVNESNDCPCSKSLGASTANIVVQIPKWIPKPKLSPIFWASRCDAPMIPWEDADGDGVCDASDDCDDTPIWDQPVDDNGCGPTQRDTDGDGVVDRWDMCPGTAPGEEVDENGCPAFDPADDQDGDGIPDEFDLCPNVNPEDYGIPVRCSIFGCPADFDGDGVGYNCDRCPDSHPFLPVDEHGCQIIPDDPYRPKAPKIEPVDPLDT
jgi:hypothetical protein